MAPRISKFWTALSFLSLFPVIAAQAAEWHKQYQVGANPEFHLRASDASVTADVSSDGTISASITTRGVSFGNDGVRVIEHQSGDIVNLEVAEPSWTFGLGSYSIEIRVHVPRKLLLDIHTSDGDVTLRGMAGSLRVETGDGGIQGSDLAGNIETRSGDGDVHITGAFSGLRVHTGDGSAEIHALPATHLNSEWRVESGDGDVRLVLPRDLAADLRLHTGDGSIHVDLPVHLLGEKEDNNLRGQLNGGGTLIDVHTGDGSINISGS